MRWSHTRQSLKLYFIARRSGASYSLCGVDGFIPYSLMDFQRLVSQSQGTPAEAPYTYLVNKKLTVLLTEVSILSPFPCLLPLFVWTIEQGMQHHFTLFFILDYLGVIRLCLWTLYFSFPVRNKGFPSHLLPSMPYLERKLQNSSLLM